METDVERLDRVVETLQDALKEAFELFALPDGRRTGGGWRYDVPSGREREADGKRPAEGTGPATKIAKKSDFSQGTTAMVLCAILAALGDLGRSVTLPLGSLRASPLRDLLQETYADPIENGKARIDLGEIADKLSENVVAEGVTSRTFGTKDPFTLTWLLELVNSTGRFRSFAGPKLDVMRPKLLDAIEDAKKRKEEWYVPKDDEKGLFARVQNNPFPILRHRHATKLAAIGVNGEATGTAGEADHEKPVQRQSFEATFLKHVAYSTMKDSRFDPAELAFAFEGLLQVDFHPDGDMVERFLSIMEAAQVSSAYWRPVNPLLVSSTGLVLHPVSVETALSLLRSCALLDREPRSVGVTARVVPMLERYWAWLRSRKTTLEVDGKPYAGWHSEHVNQTQTIHMWETSQVVLFVVGFQELIGRYVARMGAKAARLDVDASGVKPDADGKTKKANWEETLADFEPVKLLGTPFEVYRRIDESMVTPRLNLQAVPSDGYSALLFGPPGTGKTTIAKKVAEALNWPYVNVTVSDFLAEGADVEARAKSVFDILARQQDVVVLFDEIDQLLLDRDSKLYTLQDSVVQLLTPGMLPKLQKLRDAKNCVFFVATNYADRIDPAIKRRGRIDLSLPVLPLDSERRRAKVEKFAGDLLGAEDDPARPETCDRAVRASFLLGHNDIKAVAEQTRRARKLDPSADFVEALAGASRSMRMTGYRARFDGSSGQPQLPLEELFLMAALALAEQEADGSEGSGTDVVAAEIAAFDNLVGTKVVPTDEAHVNAVLPRRKDEAKAITSLRDRLVPGK